MKVQVANIPSDGVDLNFEMDRQWLLDSLEDGDSLRDFINGGLACACHLESAKDKIFITGKASLKLKPVCYRCGRKFDKNLQSDFSITCIPDTRRVAERGQDYMDGDVGLNYYSGFEIDIAKICREQLLLTVPMSFICDADCKGLCPKCGNDLNVEQCSCSGEIANSLKD